MFLGPVRGIVVKIFLQILGYELRLRLRLVTKLSGWEDEAGILGAGCGSWPFPLGKMCPSTICAAQTPRHTCSAVQVPPGDFLLKRGRAAKCSSRSLMEGERQQPGPFLVIVG